MCVICDAQWHHKLNTQITSVESLNSLLQLVDQVQNSIKRRKKNNEKKETLKKKGNSMCADCRVLLFCLFSVFVRVIRDLKLVDT